MYKAEFDVHRKVMDLANIELNLPGIEKCRSCHTASGAADNCIACHLLAPGDDFVYLHDAVARR